MQQQEARHRITIRIVSVDWQRSNTTIVKDAAFVGLANETEVCGNLQHSGMFDRYVAGESQPMRSHVIEPIFADRWIRDPVRIGTPDEVRGRLPHPRQARGP